MKVRFFCAILLVALSINSCAIADVKTHFAEKALVRLQVVGASDSERDQEVKLQVRDAVREVALPLAADAKSPEEACELLRMNLPAIAAAARAVDKTAQVEIVRARFPIRLYGDVAVPPGNYMALRITLGEGAGRNWWCVVYPDLCATDVKVESAIKNGEPVKFYSSILKWLRGGDTK